MNITQQELGQLARLAGLELDEAEQVGLSSDLENILACMRTLDGGAGTEECAEECGQNVLRADLCQPSMAREQLLANAPEQNGQYILVPRTVE